MIFYYFDRNQVEWGFRFLLILCSFNLSVLNSVIYVAPWVSSELFRIFYVLQYAYLTFWITLPKVVTYFLIYFERV